MIDIVVLCRLATVKVMLLWSLLQSTHQRQSLTAWTITSCLIACLNVSVSSFICRFCKKLCQLILLWDWLDFTFSTRMTNIAFYFFGQFDTVGGPPGECLACKNWVMRCWHGFLSRLGCNFAPIIVSCFIKIQIFMPFWCRLTQVAIEKATKRVFVLC